MTHYLKFVDHETAIDALQNAGYELSEYSDHCSGNGWGPVLPCENGIEVNLYDCTAEIDESLQQYVVPPPKTPNNVRAGD